MVAFKQGIIDDSLVLANYFLEDGVGCSCQQQIKNSNLKGRTINFLISSLSYIIKANTDGVSKFK